MLLNNIFLKISLSWSWSLNITQTSKAGKWLKNLIVSFISLISEFTSQFMYVTNAEVKEN